ncbi:MFS transporter [Pseudomonas sp. BN415]|uniref:spinster family MFS transporter n=1 Tax=Pseudomonas sp. BN415 TaxID=2567889 RepID=UPI002455596E|nr:MFS transporter [Pseudomonas sp. BN415]MDH4580735.1 MFS transporter [Pseudomonas sp. BN415]
MNNNNTGYPSPQRAWSMVLILMCAYILSFVDRQILSLLVEPIRRDLLLNDTQISLLMGLAFALFYTLCGLPLGRAADSRSRRGIIAIGILVWSAATAFCGLAKNYWHFLIGRIGVGAGEAALNPAAYSLIADSFPDDRRATAMSVYAMGVYLGSGVAYMLGGLIIKFASAQGDIALPILGEIRHWQMIFIILGALGIAFTLTLLAIKEPGRRGAGAGVAVPIKDVGRYMASNRSTVLLHNFGFALLMLVGYGMGAWAPSFFIRTYGWTPTEVGLIYGSIVLVCGCLGVVSGGRLADYLRKRGYKDASMRVGLIAAVLGLPTAFAPLASTGELAAALQIPAVFFMSMPIGVAVAALQEIMPNQMRGQAVALYSLIASLIGLGLGPTAVALITDYGFRDPMAVRYSMVIVSLIGLSTGALLLGRGLVHFRRTREALAHWRPPVAGQSIETSSSASGQANVNTKI